MPQETTLDLSQFKGRSLFIGNVSNKVHEDVLMDDFWAMLVPFGPIYQLNMNIDNKYRPSVFAHFYRCADALKAAKAISGAWYCGRQLRVEMARPRDGEIEEEPCSHEECRDDWDPWAEYCQTLDRPMFWWEYYMMANPTRCYPTFAWTRWGG